MSVLLPCFGLVGYQARPEGRSTRYFFPIEETPFRALNRIHTDEENLRIEPLERRGKKMKTSWMGAVLAAILMVVAGVGLGVAQAGGNSSDNPAWTAQDQAAADQYKDFLAGPIETGEMPEATHVAMSGEEFVPEGNYSGTDWQLGGPVETGSVPEMSGVTDLDHTDIPREGNVYQYWGAENPSN